ENAAPWIPAEVWSLLEAAEHFATLPPLGKGSWAKEARLAGMLSFSRRLRQRAFAEGVLANKLAQGSQRKRWEVLGQRQAWFPKALPPRSCEMPDVGGCSAAAPLWRG
ncbi:hypothetical protein HispidOSU_002306, partial [Sigmodon hispidus]